jgi:hypothetical protein
MMMIVTHRKNSLIAGEQDHQKAIEAIRRERKFSTPVYL